MFNYNMYTKLKIHFKTHKEFYSFVFVSLVIYIIFFYKLFDSRFTFWSSDAKTGTFPVQIYLSEKLRNFEFPFWSERAYLGYAPYQDSEIGFLNPINIVFTFLFGYRSLNFVHFFTYLVGAISFYKLLEKHNYTFWSKVAGIIPFYFSFFHLNHLSHTMIIFISMLLPLNILLVRKFIETPKLRYIIIQGIVLSIELTWGHPQILLINLIGIFLYCFFNFKKYKDLIYYIFFTFIFFISFSMIQIFPTYQAYFQSERFVNELKYAKLSNIPLLNSTLIFPYLFGYFWNYQGIEISGGLSFVETYNYLGITTFILLLYYLLFGSGDRNYKMVLAVVYFYLIISSLKSIPVLENYSIPIIDSLRYWTRSIYLVLFFSSFGIIYILNNKLLIKDLRIKPLIPLLLLLFVSNFFSSNPLISETFNFLISRSFDYLKKIDILIWGLLMILSIILISLKNKILFKLLPLFVVLIMLFDFRYFSLDFTSIRITRFSNPNRISIPAVCLYQRCLLENTDYSSYEGIATKAYTPYGYSQFSGMEYLEFYSKNIGGNPKFSSRSENLRPNLNLIELEKAGFRAIVMANHNNIYYFKEKKIDLFVEDLSGKYIRRNEGDILLEVVVPESGKYQTTLRYSPYWDVKINGNTSRIEKSGIFTNLYLEKGSNLISIKYIPYDLIYGILIGFCLFIFGYFFYTFLIKRSLWVVTPSKDI